MENIPMRNSALKAIADKRLAQENGVKTGDPIKKTQTVDPDTGAVTYKHSWSGSMESSKPSKLIVRRSSPTISSVGSKAAKKESGSREFTSVPRMTPAGLTEDTKTIAKIQPVSKEEIKSSLKDYQKSKKEANIRDIYDKSYNETKKSGQSFDTWYNDLNERTKVNSKKAKDKGSKGVFMKDDPSNDKLCRSC